MDRIRIRGGNPIRGKIPIGGAKNAALPLMIACLLTDAPLRTRLAQQFSAHVRQNFSFATNARRYAQLYRRVLDGTLEDSQS